ncbi:MAG: hypothetical protein A2Y65_10840 [Deltaproteobacteria bacterium RBG_13_52_11]|nr:MAG: hypothetical protein A2Y65_10840 [Deltaproteobacteria bacterium RBG_13_52_11]
MNIYQRIVLVLGAAALVAAILTAPTIYIISGSYAKLSAQQFIQIELQPVISPATALIYSVGVIGVTVLLFFALKGEIKRRPKKTKPKK